MGFITPSTQLWLDHKEAKREIIAELIAKGAQPEDIQRELRELIREYISRRDPKLYISNTNLLIYEDINLFFAVPDSYNSGAYASRTDEWRASFRPFLVSQGEL